MRRHFTTLLALVASSLAATSLLQTQDWSTCAPKPRRTPPAARPRRPLPRDRAEDDDGVADAANDVVVAIVTQTDAGRLPKVKHLCDRWRGPLSLAVLGSPGTSDAIRRDALAHASRCGAKPAQVKKKNYAARRRRRRG